MQRFFHYVLLPRVDELRAEGPIPPKTRYLKGLHPLVHDECTPWDGINKSFPVYFFRYFVFS